MATAIEQDYRTSFKPHDTSSSVMRKRPMLVRYGKEAGGCKSPFGIC